PMARYVSDLVLTLPVLIGPDGVDSGVVPVPLPKRTPLLPGLKVAWYADDGLMKPTPAVAAAVRAAAKALSAAGCLVTEERLPGLSEAEQVTLGYWGRKHMSHERLYRRWDAFRTSVLTFMSRFDLVLSPVAPDVAPLYRARSTPDHQYTYTIPYSLSGNPCVVVRAGTSAENMPIGVQVVARSWNDLVALRAARAIERALGGGPLQPGLDGRGAAAEGTGRDRHRAKRDRAPVERGDARRSIAARPHRAEADRPARPPAGRPRRSGQGPAELRVRRRRGAPEVRRADAAAAKAGARPDVPGHQRIAAADAGPGPLARPRHGARPEQDARAADGGPHA